MSTNTTPKDEPTDTELPTDNLAVADTGAGLLVYELEYEYRTHLGRETEVARRLIGFADVSDWNAIAEAVRARGGGAGDVAHLPEFDSDALPDSAEVDA
jgi:2,4-dienoyl-CoA reductase-like NADH-dependent reductase (Old Yellow Enzyme family)